MASSRGLDRAISAALREALGFLNQHLESDAPGQSQLRLQLGQEHIDPPDVTGRSSLGDNDHVERFPGSRHDFNDVAVTPRRVETVDPDRSDSVAPIAAGQGPDGDAAGRFLHGWCTGIFEIEKDQIGTGRRRLLTHLLAAGRRRQL